MNSIGDIAVLGLIFGMIGTTIRRNMWSYTKLKFK